MRKVVITGCSGGGKSSLISKLSSRGHAVVKEPGRRVIAAERAGGGTGFPWEDAERFADLAFWMAVGDHATATADVTFFDRSALDQAAWYARQNSRPPGEVPGYDRTVFLAPPWQEIFENDPDRQHGFADAVAEYDDLLARLPTWGYTPVILPKTSVIERADFIVNAVTRSPAA
ncbi:MAG: AAA family ATPase [Pseudomonadota bacterium]